MPVRYADNVPSEPVEPGRGTELASLHGSGLSPRPLFPENCPKQATLPRLPIKSLCRNQ